MRLMNAAMLTNCILGNALHVGPLPACGNDNYYYCILHMKQDIIVPCMVKYAVKCN